MDHQYEGSRRVLDETTHVDKAVARRILAGDEAALRSLFDQFFPRLYRFALARLGGDREAATDVVQQTFCKAIERLECALLAKEKGEALHQGEAFETLPRSIRQELGALGESPGSSPPKG